MGQRVRFTHTFSSQALIGLHTLCLADLAEGDNRGNGREKIRMSG